MDVCELAVHRDTYLDIWVRRVIIITIDTVMDIVMILDIPVMISVMFPGCDTYYDFRDSSYIYSYDS